ncbi:MAG: hypothetical protein WDN69_09410 [Aliidongia sp.]
MDVLVSDSGVLWSPSGEELPRPPLLGPGALASAARLGAPSYVRLHLGTRGACLHIGQVPITRACFERLVWLLVMKQVDRAIIEYHGGREEPEMLTTQQDIVARLDEIRGEAPGEPPRPAFFLERMSLERLDETRRLPMRAAWKAWGRARGRLSVPELNRESGRIDGGRMLLRVQRGERLETNAVSDVVRSYLPCERMSMLGRDVEEQPDGVYGEWLAAAYRELAEDETPAAGLQLVEAVIATPGGRSVRTRYERLLLPWRSPGGDRWITSQPLLRMRRLIKH